MFGSQILDTVIGLVFVLLLVSILVTTANEIIASVLKSRAKWLRIGVDQLLGSEWAAHFYAHPLINGSTRGGQGPSYIPSRAFAIVVLDVVNQAAPSLRAAKNALQDALARVPTGAGTIDALKASVLNTTAAFDTTSKALTAIKGGVEALVRGMPPTGDATYTVGDAKNDIQAFSDGLSDRYLRQVLDDLPSSSLKQSLAILLDDADQDIAKFKENIEVWFNNAMDRVGGWYKRKSQYVVGGLALALTLALNVDALLILQQLNTQSGLRDSLVAQARTFGERPPIILQSNASATGDAKPAAAGSDDNLQNNFRVIRNQLNQLSLPIGWFVSEAPADKTAMSATSPAPTKADSTSANSASEFRKANFLYVPWTRDGEGLKTIWFHLTGWLLTALAASMGAPFWFDILNKIMSIRSAGKAPEEAPKSPKDVPVPLEPGQSPREADRATR